MMRYAWAAALVVLIDGIVTLLVAYTRKPIYRSETVILFREGIRSTYLGGSETADPVRKLGLRLKEMVLSRPRLQAIIDQYKLYPDIVEDRGYVDAVDEMRNHILFRVRDSDTFGLSFEGQNPELVQAVTARLAETLIEENSRNRSEQAEETKEFLDAEKKRTEDELKAKQMEMAKFLAKHPEFALEPGAASGAGASIRAASKKEGSKPGADPTLLALEREAGRLRDRLGMPLKKRQSDPRLLAARNDAEAELTAAQKDLADKQSRYTEQHPDVRAAKQRVASAEARLRHAIESLVTADTKAVQSWAELESEVDRSELQGQLDKVQQQIASYKSKKRHEEQAAEGAEKQAAGGSGASWIVALETEWARLTRELDEVSKRTQDIEDKRARAAIAASGVLTGRAAQMVVVDPAYRPTRPAKAGRWTIAGLGLLVSLGLGVTLAFGCALFDDRVYDRIDLERQDVGHLLIVVPRAVSGRRGG